ncbi:MAG: hypothetical protein ISS55_03875 [Dehalococcoidales bacterium]|nr:hypothetical protein [Dehalococcoidales bacterium]
MKVTRHRLKYYPFPSEKDKTGKEQREYVIGEALLRDKGIPEDELATLDIVRPDPPDLRINTKDYGQLGIEVTEAVPHSRENIHRGKQFLEELRRRLETLGTKPQRRLNILLNRSRFCMPKLKEEEIEHIAHQTDDYCRRDSFPDVDTEVTDVGPFKIKVSSVSSSSSYRMVAGNPPIHISIVPASGAFDYPAGQYQNNLLFGDNTGFPIDSEQIKESISHIMQPNKKGRPAFPADILVIWAMIGSLGFDEVSEEIRRGLLCGLSFSGIYILQITQGKNEYIVHVTTVREHPRFQVKN